MLKEIVRKIKRYFYFLNWSYKRRLELVSLIFLALSIIFGISVSLISFGDNPLGKMPERLDRQRHNLVSQIADLKRKIFTEPEIYHFDLSDVQQYALDTLDDLTTNELIYVKGELEKETRIDPELPRYPGSVPPPKKPSLKPPGPPEPPEAEKPEVEPIPEPVLPPPVEPEPDPIQPPQPTDPQKLAEEILKYINIERQKAGVGELSMNNTLVTITLAHSQDMHERGYFSHTTPEGITFPQRLQSAGFLAGGENLYFAGKARGSFSPNEPVEAWMKSPGHRQNMLYSKFKQAGIGVSGPYVTANFIP